MGEKFSDLRRKISRTVVIWPLFVSRWPIRRIFLQKILLFYIFSDLQVTFFLVFSLYQFKNGRQNCIFHANKKLCIKKNILTKLLFYHFRTTRDFSLNFHWYIWCVVVKTTVYVFRGAVWEGFRTMRESY